MKITVIHGSPKKGNTYKAAQIFIKEIKRMGEAEFIEFNAYSDMPQLCKGCTMCIIKGEEKCPHWQYSSPILDAMESSDAIIVTTPVFVMQMSGGLKNLLDHFGYLFINHRAMPEMFSKKVFVISTAAGAGMKQANKTIKSILKYWGINRIWTKGFSIFAPSWNDMPKQKQEKYNKVLKKSAIRFYNDVVSEKKHTPYLFTRFFFFISKMLNKSYDDNSIDKLYWKSTGWFENKSPF